MPSHEHDLVREERKGNRSFLFSGKRFELWVDGWGRRGRGGGGRGGGAVVLGRAGNMGLARRAGPFSCKPEEGRACCFGEKIGERGPARILGPFPSCILKKIAYDCLFNL